MGLRLDPPSRLPLDAVREGIDTKDAGGILAG